MILQAKKLGKKYGSKIAVDHFNLGIERGHCLGILGPNGAGKTTTLKMLQGVLRPSSGEVLFHGKPIDRFYQSHIGIMFQSTALPENQRVLETLKFFSSLYPRKASLSELIDELKLQQFLQSNVDQLSGGQRQCILLALALVGDPDIVFLDEPTTGLDPAAREIFWHCIENLKMKEKTVVLTTHYMEEAERLCDSIVFMKDGFLLEGSKIQDCLRGLNSESIILLPSVHRDRVTAISSDVLAAVVAPTLDAGELFALKSRCLNTTLSCLLDLQVPLQNIQIQQQGLSELFLQFDELELAGSATKS